MPAPRLWLVRHARPLTEPGICYGRLDVPADAQASRAAAAALADALPAVACVRHSPLRRCKQLALDLQALRPDLTSTAEPRIAEMDFGVWEGRAWSAIARAEIDAWTARFASHAPGGGEPLAAMLLRVAAALHDAAYEADRRGDADVVWITHAGVARCVHWLQAHGVEHVPQPRDWSMDPLDFGAWSVTRLGQ
jgi:alpha-ribazole phosphatase